MFTVDELRTICSALNLRLIDLIERMEDRERELNFWRDMLTRKRYYQDHKVEDIITEEKENIEGYREDIKFTDELYTKAKKILKEKENGIQ